jgi:hypothetical protein
MRTGAAGDRGSSSWSRQSTPGPGPASWAAVLALLLAACGTSGGGSEAGAGAEVGSGDAPLSPADGAAPDAAAPDAMASSCDAMGPGCSGAGVDASPADVPVLPDGPFSSETNPVPDASIVPDYPPNGVRALDILFMIDNSPSMQEEQLNLRRNFPIFMDELKKIPGGLPDIHIGVISSDLGAGSTPLANGGCARPGGDRGIFQTKPNCGLDGNSRFLTSLDNGTMNNFTGPIENVFSCLANLGTAGCGYEHQLQATRVALYEVVTRENAGFLRQNAVLAIVLITDEDDCSAETTSNLFTDDASFPMTTASFRCSQVGHLCNGLPPPIAPFETALDSCQANPAGRLIKVADVVDSIRALKAQPARDIVVAGIFGWPTSTVGARYRYVQSNQGVDVAPVCQSTNGEAAAGLRLKTFVESFGASGSFFSICQDDYSPALQKIAQAVATRF